MLPPQLPAHKWYLYCFPGPIKAFQPIKMHYALQPWIWHGITSHRGGPSGSHVTDRHILTILVGPYATKNTKHLVCVCRNFTLQKISVQKIHQESKFSTRAKRSESLKNFTSWTAVSATTKLNGLQLLLFPSSDLFLFPNERTCLVFSRRSRWRFNTSESAIRTLVFVMQPSPIKTVAAVNVAGANTRSQTLVHHLKIDRDWHTPFWFPTKPSKVTRWIYCLQDHCMGYSGRVQRSAWTPALCFGSILRLLGPRTSEETGLVLVWWLRKFVMCPVLSRSTHTRPPLARV